MLNKISRPRFAPGTSRSENKRLLLPLTIVCEKNFSKWGVTFQEVYQYGPRYNTPHTL